VARQGIKLREGLVLTFYMDDADDDGVPDELRAEGVVSYDKSTCSWVASVDWSAIRHASDDGGPSTDGCGLSHLGLANKNKLTGESGAPTTSTQ